MGSLILSLGGIIISWLVGIKLPGQNITIKKLKKFLEKNYLR